METDSFSAPAAGGADWSSPSPLEQLLDALPAAAYLCDADGLITFFNSHAEKLWGRAPRVKDPTERYCGSCKLYSPDGSPVAHEDCWMAQALSAGRTFRGEEIVIERPDGSRRNVLVNVKPLRDQSGKIIGAVNVVADVSEARSADETRARLAAIVESSDDAIISKSLDGVIRSWNAAAERLYGYTAAEAVGSPISMIIPPDRLEEERMIIGRIRNGEPVDHFETIRVTKHGMQVPVSLTISPIRDSTGRIIGASKIARDITLQKEAEAAMASLNVSLASQLDDLRLLREMSSRLAATLEVQPILDETLKTAAAIEGANLGLVLLCDPEKQELRLRASLGLHGDFLRLAENSASGRGACGTCYAERRRVVVEDVETDPLFADYREAASKAGFRAVHGTPLLTRSGKIIGVLCTYFSQPYRPTDRVMHLVDLCARQAVDFIENARLYDQLREADRRKNEFLATLAHELRNPLAPISNSLHLLRLSGDLTPTTRRVSEIMEGQVNHLVRLVEDLLDVSRITRGKIDLRREPTTLAAIVCTAVETSRPLVDASGHQLAVTLPPEPLCLEADPVRLAQVVANLLNNAAKYTNEGGQIWLSVHREGNQAVLSVRDNGVGMPVEMLGRVFDMFSQVDQTVARSRGGLGIGLTLAKNLVQLHGGQIEARSEGPGKGSEFVVRLPLATGNVPSVERQAETDGSGIETLPSFDILVVDDARASAMILSKLLSAMGQRARSATDAAAALDAARHERPDVILSDIAMPEVDGYELARRIRREPGLENVVLVALTGYSQESDRERTREAGFDHHLVKPVTPEALKGILKTLPPRSVHLPTG